jgi:hypothetical protein
MFFYVLMMLWLGIWLGRRIVRLAKNWFRLPTIRKGGPQMITLNLCFMPLALTTSLCSSCRFSHVVRGFNREELIFCGYTFPLREVLFAVKECTDFRSERETVSAYMAASAN